MSYPLTQRPVAAHHHQNPQHAPPRNAAQIEEEYDRLRDVARAETNRRHALIGRSRAAYSAGDKAAAHDLSVQAKAADAESDRLNAKARDFILTANNANSEPGKIDLHGLYVEEVQGVLDGLVDGRWCVVVGKGNHSQKLPVLGKEVRKVASERGWEVEEDEGNSGRLWVQIGRGGHAGQSYHAPQQQQHSPQNTHQNVEQPPQEEEKKGLLVQILEGLCGKNCSIM